MRFAAIRAMAITGALAVMIPLHGATPPACADEIRDVAEYIRQVLAVQARQ